MSHNSFGHLLRVTTWGESHGPAIGCVVDGAPPRLALSETDIQHWLDRRRPGGSRGRRVMRWLAILLALGVAATGATYLRYESFSPCDWMARDLESSTGLPGLIVQARIKGHFLLEGIADPDQVDCLLAWWDLRRDGLPPDS